MNFGAVEKIANAVLYEGYLLYPYRASAVKNQQRFNFGVIYPREYCERQGGSCAWEMRTECLAFGAAETAIEIKVRFLQMIECEGRQEGVEQEICISSLRLSTLSSTPITRGFAFDGELRGEVEITAGLSSSATRIRLTVRNGTSDGTGDVLLRSLVSVHSIWGITEGEFISLLDPAEEHKVAATSCENLGTFPVLVGEEGQRDMLLSSPIILYDYPQIAPESPGDLFDGTEIDEILALRILTLTDAEKLEVRNGDDRARRILERTESLPPEHFQKLHGALRGLR
ncbi:MAG TPA: hypothetical protein VK789_02090 [Bryobacteraceae bacterium]|nr:hypothetical protein [Bryobacteraceae bacterium]